MSKEKGATVEIHSNVPKTKHIDRNGIDAALDKKEKNEYHKSFENNSAANNRTDQNLALIGRAVT